MQSLCLRVIVLANVMVALQVLADDSTYCGTNQFYAAHLKGYSELSSENRLEAETRLSPVAQRRDDPSAPLRSVPNPNVYFSIGDNVTSLKQHFAVLSVGNVLRHEYSREAMDRNHENTNRLFQLPGGKDWYKQHVSDEIRDWLRLVDEEYYQVNYMSADRTPASARDDSARIYLLPDGSRIWIRQDSLQFLRRYWQENFRHPEI